MMKQAQTTYISHACWQRCSCSGGLHLGKKRSTRGRENPPVWFGDHM